MDQRRDLRGGKMLSGDTFHATDTKFISCSIIFYPPARCNMFLAQLTAEENAEVRLEQTTTKTLSAFLTLLPGTGFSNGFHLLL